MSEGALAPILSWLGWAFIPGWATSILQNIYYKITIPVGQTAPRPGSQLFAKHYRRIRVLVLTLYLLYTLAQSLYDVRLEGDFFTLLSVTPDTADREIRSRFRRLAAKYHPDKMQSNTYTAEDITSSSDARFLILRLAQDTLLNPTARYAYTRFGPSIVQSTLNPNLKPSIRTYVYAGLKQNLLPSYIINVAALTALNYFVLPKWGTYWRYYVLTFIFTIELYFLTHSNPSFTSLVPSILTTTTITPLQILFNLLKQHTKLNAILPPHLLPYQTLSVLRRLSISLNIFISQLAPPKQATEFNSLTTEAGAKQQISNLLSNINQSLSHIGAISKRADQETTSLLSLQLAPLKGDVAKTEKLKEGMKEGVFRGALLGNEDVRKAVESAQRRKKSTVSSSSSSAPPPPPPSSLPIPS